MSKTYKQKGFTLIEVLIASSIFVVVISLSVTTFGMASTVQNKNNAIKEATDTSRFILESISRDIRLANYIQINQNGDQIDLVFDNEQNASYYFVSEDSNGELYYTDDSLDESVGLTNNKVKITGLQFSGIDDNSSNSVQTYVSVKITFVADVGEFGKSSEVQTQTLETTISTRTYRKGYIN